MELADQPRISQQSLTLQRKLNIVFGFALKNMSQGMQSPSPKRYILQTIRATEKT